MKKMLTPAALGLLASTLATPALAADPDPAATTKEAGALATNPPPQERPRPVLWDRLDKGALERQARARKPRPAELPADIVEPADRK